MDEHLRQVDCQQNKNVQLQKWIFVAGLAVVAIGCRTATNQTVVVDPFAESSRVAAVQANEPAAVSKPQEQEAATESRRLPAISHAISEEDSSRVHLAAYQGEGSLQLANPSELEALPAGEESVLSSDSIVGSEMTEVDSLPSIHSIDLSNALALGGGSSLQVGIARTRVLEAQARYLQAKARWIPSLRFGIGYNNHSGRLQETEGNVIEVSRSSLFLGGGAGLGGTPLTGGAGGPPRLFVNLSVADAAFEPLVASQLVHAARAGQNATFNTELLAIAEAYFTLVEASGQLANQRLALADSQAMVKRVSAFEKGGLSSKTEVERAKTDRAAREQSVENAARNATMQSAQLARLLRLPPQVQLMPVEDFVVPVEFLMTDVPVESLISQGQGSRPEVVQASARLQAACWRTKQEKMRPLLPNLQAGVSAGTFGGGTGGNFDNFGSRSDVDVLAVWELLGAGVGNVGLVREARSVCRRAEYELADVRDRIASEIVVAHADVQSYRRQVDIAQGALDTAGASYELNSKRIQEGEGLPIELLQAISALTDARNAYTEAVANYHRAQYQLMQSIGQPPVASAPVVSVALP